MHAIISGAGISGLSAARFLTERGWDATVVERAAGPCPEGYMIDFFGPGWEAAGRRAAQWFVPQTAWQGFLRRAAIRAMRIPGLNRFLGSGIVGKQGSPV